MHPAISVIFFTVTSGAGFGFLALIGLGVPMPDGGVGAFMAAAIAGLLSVAGLISSTFHLGHPERAWRAFSQWRSSWLSREGVCAVITLVLFGFYALNWVFFETRIVWLGLLVSLGSAITVFTTRNDLCPTENRSPLEHHANPDLLWTVRAGLRRIAGSKLWRLARNRRS